MEPRSIFLLGIKQRQFSNSGDKRTNTGRPHLWWGYKREVWILAYNSKRLSAAIQTVDKLEIKERY